MRSLFTNITAMSFAFLNAVSFVLCPPFFYTGLDYFGPLTVIENSVSSGNLLCHDSDELQRCRRRVRRRKMLSVLTARSSGTHAIVCNRRGNICTPQLENDIVEVPEGKCNPRHGILAVLKIDNERINWECMSMYGDFFNNDDTPTTTTCQGGHAKRRYCTKSSSSRL